MVGAVAYSRWAGPDQFRASVSGDGAIDQCLGPAERVVEIKAALDLGRSEVLADFRICQEQALEFPGAVERGHGVVLTREPGGSAGAELKNSPPERSRFSSMRSG